MVNNRQIQNNLIFGATIIADPIHNNAMQYIHC